MKNRSEATLVFLFIFAASCSRQSRPAFPLVQKYTTQPGDLFYFRPRDSQFVLLERRKALAIAVAPEPNIQAYAYEDRITASRPQPEGDMLENTSFVEKIGAQQALAIAPDGRTLAGGDASGLVTVWDIATRDVPLQLNEPASVLSLAFSRDGNWLAIGLAKPAREPGGTVWLYDIHGKNPHRSFGHAAVSALAWSPDGHWLAAALDDGSVLLDELGTDREPRRIVLSTSRVTALDFHPSGKFLASAHGAVIERG